MEKVCLGTCKLRSILSISRCSNDHIRTPYGLDVSLPNKERGTFHIEKGNYWKFYNLEFVYLRLGSRRHD
jgi:hypothetical protein